MPSLRRRTFVVASAGAVLAPTTPDRAVAAMIARMDGGLAEWFPAHDPEEVRAVVGKSHVDVDTVTALVTKRPALARAAWDWGFGDWESALGAASHMGRRDIAEVLLAHGARPNLYTFAMLGEVDVVRAICAARPGIQRVHGPHGLTLMHHARAGGEAAASVVAYLEELGDADVGQPDAPITAAEAGAVFVGDYVPGGAAGTVLRVAWHERRGGLTFGRDDRVIRFLRRLDRRVFAPAGADAVRVSFEGADGAPATALSVLDGDLAVRAVRAA